MDGTGSAVFKALTGADPRTASCWPAYAAHVARRNSLVHRGGEITESSAHESVDAVVGLVRFVDDVADAASRAAGSPTSSRLMMSTASPDATRASRRGSGTCPQGPAAPSRCTAVDSRRTGLDPCSSRPRPRRAARRGGGSTSRGGPGGTVWSAQRGRHQARVGCQLSRPSALCISANVSSARLGRRRPPPRPRRRCSSRPALTTPAARARPASGTASSLRTWPLPSRASSHPLDEDLLLRFGELLHRPSPFSFLQRAAANRSCQPPPPARSAYRSAGKRSSDALPTVAPEAWFR